MNSLSVFIPEASVKGHLVLKYNTLRCFYFLSEILEIIKYNATTTPHPSDTYHKNRCIQMQQSINENYSESKTIKKREK